MHFEAICPDHSLRRPILAAIADSVRAAHEVNEAAWSISLRESGPHVNVVAGRIWVLSTEGGRFWMVLKPEMLTEEAQALINDRASLQKTDEFAATSSSVSYTLPFSEVGELWPLVREAHFALVREAADKVKRTPYYKAFAPDLVDELEAELDIDLPRPRYGGGDLTVKAVDRLLSLVQAAYPGWEGFRDKRFVEDEVDYKQKKGVAFAREQLSEQILADLIANEDYDEVIQRLDRVGKKLNLLFLGVPLAGDLNILYQEGLDKAGFCSAVFALLHGDGDGPERLARYLDWIREAGIPRKANKWTFPTYFLFLLHPESEIFVKPTAVRSFVKLADLDIPLGSRPTADTYASIRDAYAQVGELLAEYEPHDMIDLQGFVWQAVSADKAGTAETTSWWVNQGNSYDLERKGGYLWAGKTDAGGRRISHHETMRQLSPGHKVFHYASGSLRAIGTVTSILEDTVRPGSQEAEPKGQPGYCVSVDYMDLPTPIELSEIPPDMRAAERGPFNAEGRVNQGYLYPVSEEFQAALVERFPTLSQFLGSPARTSHWVFQANPKIYDVMRAVEVHEEMTWLVQQHASEIRRSDSVFLWQSGPEAALVGTARVASDVAEMVEVPSHDECRVAKVERFEGKKRRVLLDSVRAIKPPVSRAQLLDQPALADVTVFSGWQGTNYRLTPEQAAVLMNQVRRPPGEQMTLVQRLESEGYYFSEEVLANYLLALQTKRFVILTGISGTGKTQLALQVARHFQPTIRQRSSVSVPEDAIELEAFPYMLKHSSMILPSAFAVTIQFPESTKPGSGKVPVKFPGGRIELSYGKEADRNVTWMSFRGAFREWFQESLQPGDRFLLRRLETAEGTHDELEFFLPATEEVERRLDNYRVIAVRPDWTDNRGLLGFLNPLTGQYARTEFLNLLLRAREEEEKAREAGRTPAPHFVILDEMNLARVEQYFSDFLSALESGEPLDLHSDDAVEAGEGETLVPVPKRLRIPSNVFFTGTVNVDETTYMFSPKVLDRAFTLELSEVDLDAYGGDVSLVRDQLYGLPLNAAPRSLRPYRKPDRSDWNSFNDLGDSALRDNVVELNGLLSRDGRQFGYRVANEIARFVSLAAERTDDQKRAWAALDIAVLQKVLPKLNGTQQELEAVLQSLFRFAVTAESHGPDSDEPFEHDWAIAGGHLVYSGADSSLVDIEPTLPRTAAKLWRMLDRLRGQGFTSYIE